MTGVAPSRATQCSYSKATPSISTPRVSFRLKRASPNARMVREFDGEDNDNEGNNPTYRMMKRNWDWRAAFGLVVSGLIAAKGELNELSPRSLTRYLIRVAYSTSSISGLATSELDSAPAASGSALLRHRSIKPSELSLSASPATSMTRSVTPAFGPIIAALL